jgi:SAM-dependent methyltransferase
VTGMDDLRCALREIHGGAVAKRLLADILRWAERDGVLERMRRLSYFTEADLCHALQFDLGYALGMGNRQRMIRLLLRLFRECGWVREVEGSWVWSPEGSAQNSGADRETPPTDAQSAREAQYGFFRRCLESVPSYLRGGSSSVLFDQTHAGAWDTFLGCAEFQICRSLLLDLMGIEHPPLCRFLDLCHGPGWGLEAAISRFPAIRVTAVDFTDVFRDTARTRAEGAQAGNRERGYAAVPITWVGPERWNGFGDPLPFPDGAFDAIFFTCGDPYIPRRLRGAMYCELGRLLAPGGRLGVLTRSYPDDGRRHVPSFWLRVSALVHDFTESVCAGWEGFSEAEETIRAFVDAGLQGSANRAGDMSLLDSSLWVVKKRCGDA